MDLKKRLNKDIVAAMQAGDSDRRNTLRLLTAAIKQAEIDSGSTFDDAAVMDVLNKQAKQRRESIADYTQGGRADLADAEAAELTVIEDYLPKQLNESDIRAIATEVIAELGVADQKGMGQVMSAMMPKVKGVADGRLVSKVVRELLAS